MRTIELNVDGCDIAHETLRLEEYGGDMMRGWRQQFTLVGGSPVAQIRRHPIDRGTALHAAPASAPEEALDGCGAVRSALFPQCP